MRTTTATILALLCAGGLSACASTTSIVGRMERTDETFTGNVSGAGYREGHGDLVLKSSRQATCSGGFTYTSRRRGQGVLNCDDGRSGPFFLSGVNGGGSGYGDLSGQRFTFTFGQPG